MYPFNRYPHLIIPTLALGQSVLLWRLGLCFERFGHLQPVIFVVIGAFATPWSVHLAINRSRQTRGGVPLRRLSIRCFVAALAGVVLFCLAAVASSRLLAGAGHTVSAPALVATMFPLVPLFIAAALGLAARPVWALRLPGSIAPVRRGRASLASLPPSSRVHADTVLFQAPPAQLGALLYVEGDMLESEPEFDRSETFSLYVGFGLFFFVAAVACGGFYGTSWRSGLIVLWSAPLAWLSLAPYLGMLRRRFFVAYVGTAGAARFSLRDGEAVRRDEYFEYADLAGAVFSRARRNVAARFLRLDSEEPLAASYGPGLSGYAVALATALGIHSTARRARELEKSGHSAFHFPPGRTLIITTNRLELQEGCDGQHATVWRFDQCHFELDGNTLVIDSQPESGRAGRTLLPLDELYDREIFVTLLRQQLAVWRPA